MAITGSTEQINIPIYDPYTGEPNPLYEELTGKKNPLTTTRNINMLKPPFEPKQSNRWLVKINNIEPFFIKETSRPSIKLIKSKFFGVTFTTKYVWQPIVIEFYDTIHDNVNQKLIKMVEDGEVFSYTLEMLDPAGYVVEEWLIQDCLISELNFSNLSYAYGRPTGVRMVVEPKEAILLLQK